MSLAFLLRNSPRSSALTLRSRSLELLQEGPLTCDFPCCSHGLRGEGMGWILTKMAKVCVLSVLSPASTRHFKCFKYTGNLMSVANLHSTQSTLGTRKGISCQFLDTHLCEWSPTPLLWFSLWQFSMSLLLIDFFRIFYLPLPLCGVVHFSPDNIFSIFLQIIPNKV